MMFRVAADEQVPKFPFLIAASEVPRAGTAALPQDLGGARAAARLFLLGTRCAGNIARRMI
jgi:hypothetical protein